MKADRQRLWLVIGVETVALTVLAAWILSRLDRLLEPVALLVGAAIIIAGDVATAIIMQRFAPTAIVVEPGEHRAGTAVAAGDFDASGRGLVSMRGERWNARARTAAGKPIRRGDKVHVRERDGLTLVVEPVD